MRRRLSWLLVPAALIVAGCIDAGVAPAALDAPAADELLRTPQAFAHAPGGTPLPLPEDVPAIASKHLDWRGAEPTLGVTSNGHIFYVAMENVLRSDDGGATWDVVSTPVSSPTTLDPYLYVDPDTDRIYSDQLYLGCSWLSYSDDYGESWITNPAACGIPVNDHQKLVSGANRGPIPTTGYGKVLYYAYNAIVDGSRVSISYDGGLTWPVNTQTVPRGEATCNGGLHGNLVAAADGTMYLPKRHCEGFILSKSTDSGLTWTTSHVGADAGGSACRKNPDLAVDKEGHVYGVWPGEDNHLYLSTSTDQGDTWREKSLDVSPPHAIMTTMPAVVAGDAGRIAVAYYGTDDAEAKGPDEVADDSVWHLYVTYSLNALDDEPTFVTVQATDDPVQIGPISTNSACDAPSGSRNLLDFIDAKLDTEGRLFVSYTDGCVDNCTKDPSMKTSRARQAGFAVLETGPSLFADVGTFDAVFRGVADATAES